MYTEEPERTYEHPDQVAEILLGVQAGVGTIWWIFVMFVQIKNVASDQQISLLAGGYTIPVIWWWERIGESNGVYNMLAASMMLTFFLYFGVSVMELIAFFVYLEGTNRAFARTYFSTIGYWGSIIGYALPWIFALVHIFN